MERMRLFREFKTILVEHVSGTGAKALENLHEHTSMTDDLGVESLDIVNIVIDIENHFNIEIDNDSIRRMSTVGNCISLIQEKMASNYVALQAI
ncbi:MAG: acyl carrier protein [Williamsia sp.]|nr:acyl carrier protein [Williamsia sp.]